MNTTPLRRASILLLVFVSMCIRSPLTLAQDVYPSRPIHIIAAAAAGGTMDLLARLIGQKLGERLGQSVVVENRAGAATILGTEYVARAQPDGYTLICAPLASIAINPAVYASLPYKASDFAPISLVGSYPFILAVTNSAPVKTVLELIAYTKANPDKANAGGPTVSFQLMTELFKLRTGAPIQYIPYRGSSEVAIALTGGQLLLSFVTASAASQIKGGQFRALAVAAPERAASFPDVPTMAEAGVPDMAATSWAGFLAPAGTPPAVLKKLEDEIIRIVRLPEITARLRDLELDPVGSTAEQFAAAISSDLATWGEVARVAKIRIGQ